MEPMDLKEATIWTKKTGKPISIVGDESNQQYGLWDGKLSKFFPGKSCSRSTSGLDFGEIIAPWQPWEEPREYVYPAVAIAMALNGDHVKHGNMREGRSVSCAENNELLYFMNGIVEGPVFELDAAYMTPGWYQVKTPFASIDPENDSTDESHEPVFDLTYEEAHLAGLKDKEKIQCQLRGGELEVDECGGIHDSAGYEISETYTAKQICEMAVSKWRIV